MSLKKQNTKPNQKAQPPVAKIRVGLITASIWERETEVGTFHNVTFERRYRDENGAWQTTHGYDTADLLGLAKAADLAHTMIIEARNAAGSEDDSTDAAE